MRGRVSGQVNVPAASSSGAASGDIKDGDDAPNDKLRQTELEDVPVEVITFFATPTDGIIIQDVLPVEAPLHALLGFQVPLRC